MREGPGFLLIRGSSSRPGPSPVTRTAPRLSDFVPKAHSSVSTVVAEAESGERRAARQVLPEREGLLVIHVEPSCMFGLGRAGVCSGPRVLIPG